MQFYGQTDNPKNFISLPFCLLFVERKREMIVEQFGIEMRFVSTDAGIFRYCLQKEPSYKPLSFKLINHLYFLILSSPCLWNSESESCSSDSSSTDTFILAVQRISFCGEKISIRFLGNTFHSILTLHPLYFLLHAHFCKLEWIAHYRHWEWEG